jgi:hypothetical protein
MRAPCENEIVLAYNLHRSFFFFLQGIEIDLRGFFFNIIGGKPIKSGLKLGDLY